MLGEGVGSGSKHLSPRKQRTQGPACRRPPALTDPFAHTPRPGGPLRWLDYAGAQPFIGTCARAAGNQTHSSRGAVSGTRSARWSTADRWARRPRGEGGQRGAVARLVWFLLLLIVCLFPSQTPKARRPGI